MWGSRQPNPKSHTGGAAAVLAAWQAVVQRGGVTGGRPLHCVMCMAENSVGPESTRPDDVHTGFSGRTVEVVNTDAEGRLVLGDGVVTRPRPPLTTTTAAAASPPCARLHTDLPAPAPSTVIRVLPSPGVPYFCLMPTVILTLCGRPTPHRCSRSTPWWMSQPSPVRRALRLANATLLSTARRRTLRC